MNNRFLGSFLPAVVLFAFLGCGGPENEVEASADEVVLDCPPVAADLARCLSLVDLCTHGGSGPRQQCGYGCIMRAVDARAERCGVFDPIKTTVYRARVSFLGVDEESLVPLDRVIESFTFALSPQPNADARPFWRCLRPGTNIDFTTHSPTCNGNGTPISQHGYSYAANTPGARPVYSCRSGDDRFLSRRADCEGRVVIGLLGYAK
jgi:hypothetical protein